MNKKKEKILVVFPDGVVNEVAHGTPYYEAVELHPHGDLVDRDVVREKIQYYDERGYATLAVGLAPTIIEAEGSET